MISRGELSSLVIRDFGAGDFSQPAFGKHAVGSWQRTMQKADRRGPGMRGRSLSALEYDRNGRHPRKPISPWAGRARSFPRTKATAGPCPNSPTERRASWAGAARRSRPTRTTRSIRSLWWWTWGQTAPSAAWFCIREAMAPMAGKGFPQDFTIQVCREGEPWRVVVGEAGLPGALERRGPIFRVRASRGTLCEGRGHPAARGRTRDVSLSVGRNLGLGGSGGEPSAREARPSQPMGRRRSGACAARTGTIPSGSMRRSRGSRGGCSRRRAGNGKRPTACWWRRARRCSSEAKAICGTAAR